LIYNKIEDVKIGMNEKNSEEFMNLIEEMNKIKE